MAKSDLKKKKLPLKTLVFLLGFLIIGLVGYLIFLPFYPLLKYRAIQSSYEPEQIAEEIKVSQEATTTPDLPSLKTLPAQPSKQNVASKAITTPKESTLSKEPINQVNRVIIKKIGVNSPIVEAPNEKWQAALNKGAWRVPQSSTPEKGSNTVISGHRYKYLPPNNLTFYLLDKLVAGDLVKVVWKNKEYNYRVKESKIVPPTAIEILNPTDKSILTIFTCDPIWTTKNRLVVTAELIE